MLENTEEWVVHRRVNDGVVSCSRRSMWDDYVATRAMVKQPILYELVAEGLTLERAVQLVNLAKEKT